jgi:AcrR family transcriptional regulator
MTTRTHPDRRQAMAGQTRRDILQTARRLFARQGYAATSVTDIASEAGVAVQTIYARLGSKRGMLMALIDLIDEEAGAGALAAGVRAAGLPEDALAAEVRLTRVFQERCGDIIGALFAAAAVEPDLAAAVAEGQRRHRDGARLAVARITELGGLRENLPPERAAALIAIATTHGAWRELRHAYGLSWDDAEALLCDTLGRAVLTTSPAPPRRRSQRKTAAAAGRPAPARLPTRQPAPRSPAITIPAVSLNRSRYRLFAARVPGPVSGTGRPGAGRPQRECLG